MSTAPLINPVRRIAALVERITSIPPTVNAAAPRWVTILELPSSLASNIPRAEIMIMREFVEIHNEIDQAEALLGQSLFNEEDYAHEFRVLRDALRPHLLAQDWSTVRAPFSETVQKTFRLLARTVDVGEPPVDGDTLQEIVESARRLEDAICSSNLPPALREALLDALASLQDGLRLYRIHGIQALRRATAVAATRMAMDDAWDEAAGEEPEVAEVRTLVQRSAAVCRAVSNGILTLNAAADDGTPIGKALQLGKNIAGLLGGMAQ